MRLVLSSSLVVASLLSAGCSSEALRFGDPFSNPFSGRSASARLSPEKSFSTASNARSSFKTGNDFARTNADNDVVTGSIRKRIIPEVTQSPLTSSAQQAWAGKGVIKPALNMPPRLREMAGGWSSVGGTNISVRSGETIKSLSEKYGVPTSAIAKANGVSETAELPSGRSLVIPTYSINSQPVSSKKAEKELTPEKVGITGLRSQKKPEVKIVKEVVAKKPTAPQSYAKHKREHIVKEGDNLSALSNRYHIPQEQLAKANGLDKWGQVKVGQTLVVPAIAATQVVKAKPVIATQVAQAKPVVKPQVVAMRPKMKEDPIVTGSISKPQKVSAMKPVVEDKVVKTAAVTEAPARSELEFRWPLRSAKVISNFGDDLNGIANEGINFSVPEGTEIRAAEEGEVVYAGNGAKEPSLKNYGNLILMRHADKFVTVYAHAKDVTVKVGDKVRRGQVIGRVGQTGSVSSPQLHFEVRQGKQSIDPEQKIRG